MFVKPINGRSVPDPERGGLLPAEGRNVEPSSYWLRRLEDGDIAKADQPETAAAASSDKQEG